MTNLTQEQINELRKIDFNDMYKARLVKEEKKEATVTRHGLKVKNDWIKKLFNK